MSNKNTPILHTLYLYKSQKIFTPYICTNNKKYYTPIICTNNKKYYTSNICTNKKKGYCHRLTTNWAHIIVVVTPVGIEPTTTHPGEHLCFTPIP